MVYRIFVEKKKEFCFESNEILYNLSENVGIKLEYIKVIKRYDIENITKNMYEKAKKCIFSEPTTDIIYEELPNFDGKYFAFEYIPGQFDARANSAMECLKILGSESSVVKTAKVIVVPNISDEELQIIKNYLVNPIECQIVDDEIFTSLNNKKQSENPKNKNIRYANLKNQSCEKIKKQYELIMDLEDIEIVKTEFEKKKREPTVEEIKIIDTYWSDHCRHGTFNTEIKKIEIESEIIKKANEKYLEIKKNINPDSETTLMNIAILAKEKLKKEGKLKNLDESKEINACTIRIKVPFEDKKNERNNNEEKKDDEKTDWLIMFKNETHNHPTEIEPFGGAATCLGGAIRDPLSGRTYVYQSMRITGAANPYLKNRLKGKLSQRQITTGAAKGFSSYGNQMGLSTGLVREFYHERFLAKRMEVGFTIGAAPFENIKRLEPAPGDIIILLGGKTGRDGIGGATGSSKIHSEKTSKIAANEVQKGNPLEERKIQRLFKNAKATLMIKRCNDFGAGGISVAIGEIANGVTVDLDKIPTKFLGLTALELILSESQERMAVVLDKSNENEFIKMCDEENLEATVVGYINDRNRLEMIWQQQKIVNLDRDFLNKNGSKKFADARVINFKRGKEIFKTPKEITENKESYVEFLEDLNICSQRPLVERFDSTVGARSVINPFGGKYESTPENIMASKLPLFKSSKYSHKTSEDARTLEKKIEKEKKASFGEMKNSLEKTKTTYEEMKILPEEIENLYQEIETSTVCSFGYDPYLSENNPFLGSIYAVIQSVSNLIASGIKTKNIYLTFQEYFGSLSNEEKWGESFSSLLGAFIAEIELSIAAIGGKDSVSGNFGELSVPPTLISFSVGVTSANNIISSEFKSSGHTIILLKPEMDEDFYPNFVSLKNIYSTIENMTDKGLIFSARSIGIGGIFETISKMSFGNKIGIIAKNMDLELLNLKLYGSIIIEIENEEILKNNNISEYILVGKTVNEEVIKINEITLELNNLQKKWEKPLVSVFDPLFMSNEKREKISLPTDKETEDSIHLINKKIEDSMPQTSEESTLLKNEKNENESFSDQIMKHSNNVTRFGKPRVLIPAFPGTNCEYESEIAFNKAGAICNTLVFKNKTKGDIDESIENFYKNTNDSQIIMFPGGFSAGDEPDGSGKFVVNILKNQKISETIEKFLYNGGLIIGICNGFQILIKSGLLTHGKIIDLDENSPTLTFNKNGRHISKYVETIITSTSSPWLSGCKIGDIHKIVISHGEGRFFAKSKTLIELKKNQQIATRYYKSNPNGSTFEIEALTSRDGRILGKMGHSERIGPFVTKNIYGNKEQHIFENGVNHFKI